MLVLFVVICSSLVMAATEITSADCETPITTIDDYYLDGDISCSGDGIIFEISSGSTSDYLVLDCQGHSITGNSISGTNGIYSRQSEYMEIKNCEVSDFENGIFLTKANYANISNNIVYSVDKWGMVFTNSDDLIVEENHIFQNTENAGLRFWDVNNAEINSNNISENKYGITTATSSYNTFWNNYILDSDSSGIQITANSGSKLAEGITMTENIICNSGDYDFNSYNDDPYFPQVSGSDNYFGLSDGTLIQLTNDGWPTFEDGDNNNYCDSNSDDDVDSDGNPIYDYQDNCVDDDNSDQADSDGDGVGDVCDDSDEDGVMDDVDICSGFDDSVDSDSDGTPDGCDTETSYASCTDSVDNDGDEDTDSDDPDCACLSEFDKCVDEESCSDFSGAWDTTNALCLNPDDDDDGDGCTNQGEIDNGLDPTTNPNDCPIDGDLNIDYVVDTDDLDEFKTAFESDYRSTSYSGLADLNDDGEFTFADVLLFVNYYVR
jgi:parallel beta-helix repeat protein